MSGSRADTRAGNKSDTHLGQPVSIDEVIARYPGQWILMQVTASENGWPSRGYLLAHGDSYEEVCQARSTRLRMLAPGEGLLYLFDAYPPIRTGEELGRSLQELREQEDFDPFRWPRL